MKNVLLILFLFTSVCYSQVYRIDIDKTADPQLWEYLSADNGIADETFQVEFDCNIIWFFTDKEKFWYKWEILPEEIQKALMLKTEDYTGETKT
jgi:hypothetical protein